MNTARKIHSSPNIRQNSVVPISKEVSNYSGNVSEITNEVISNNFSAINFLLTDSIEVFSRKISEFSKLFELNNFKQINHIDILEKLIYEMIEYIKTNKQKIIEITNPVLMNNIKTNYLRILNFVKGNSFEMLINRLGNFKFNNLDIRLGVLNKNIVIGYRLLVSSKIESPDLPKNLNTKEIINFFTKIDVNNYNEIDLKEKYAQIREFCTNIITGEEINNLEENQLLQLSLDINFLIIEIENFLKNKDDLGLKILVNNTSGPLKRIYKKIKTELFKRQFSIDDYSKKLLTLPKYSDEKLSTNIDNFGEFLNGFRGISDYLLHYNDFNSLENEIILELRKSLQVVFQKFEEIHGKTNNKQIKYITNLYCKTPLGQIVMN